MKKETKTLLEFFQEIEDPRLDRKKQHLLSDIIMLSLIGTVCGADNWVLIEEYGKSNIDWLSQYLHLPNGIPSHDTLGRVFSLLNPKEFEKFFIDWTTQISSLTEGELISIDGKTVRGSHDRYHNKSAIHLLNAWATKNNLVIGQLLSEGKKNEIKTIPKLIDLLAVKGCIISIDAMGCQKDIAEKIIESKADYILAVKDNQHALYQEIQTAFTITTPSSTVKTITKDHGRIEIRKCTVLNNLKWVDETVNWSGLRSVIKIETSRTELSKNKTSIQTRYYISSLNTSSEQFNSLVRAHWNIENKLHYVLDVAFNEDYSRIRIGNADQNLAFIRKVVLNLLKQDTSVKMGIKNKRFKAGWDKRYLSKILNFNAIALR